MILFSKTLLIIVHLHHPLHFDPLFLHVVPILPQNLLFSRLAKLAGSLSGNLNSTGNSGSDTTVLHGEQPRNGATPGSYDVAMSAGRQQLAERSRLTRYSVLELRRMSSGLQRHPRRALQR